MTTAKNKKRQSLCTRDDIDEGTCFNERDTMIRLYAGDIKRYEFPVNKNWEYQLLIKARFVNRKTGKSFIFGGIRRADYCCSRLHRNFVKDYPEMLREAKTHGLNKCAGQANNYRETGWRDWVFDSVKEIYVVIYRIHRYRKTTVRDYNGNKVLPGQRFKVKPYELKPKKKAKKPTEKELEAKYPSPKTRVKAMARKHKKNVAMENRAFKRKKFK